MGEVVVVAGYDNREDQVALEKLRGAIPDATMFQVPCRSLALEGGALT